jgi:hypothetical protein
MGAQRFAGKRQRDLRFGPYKQLGAHGFLKHLYASAHGRLTQPKRLGRSMEPTVSCNRQECFNLIDFHKSPIHSFMYAC